MKVRKPAVAGTFYSSSPAVLSQTVDGFLTKTAQDFATGRLTRPRTAPKALISPHAGHVYSGQLAANGYALVDTAKVNRVVMTCPTHRVGIAGIAVPESKIFRTPLGDVKISPNTLQIAKQFSQVQVREDVHLHEHAIEVHLPFLQRILGDFELIPLAVGDVSPADCAEVLDALWGGEETLLVISSDLSHFQPYEIANRIDRETIAQIVNMTPGLPRESACGVRGIDGFLSTRSVQTLQPEVIGYCNSGDTAGDKSRVVGYCTISWGPRV